MTVLTKPQQAVQSCGARFRVLVSGRRFGKTILCVDELARFAAMGANRKCWYVAPTYRQAKQIAWNILYERLYPLRWIKRSNLSELSLTLVNGSTISLRGADNFDSLRGVGLDFLVMDEFADIKPEAWNEVLRATLSDKNGHALFCGTPKGRNWAYDLYTRGLDETEQDWQSFSYTTLQGGNVPPEEVEAARRELDELTFNQEYNASFVNFEGRAYYPFQIETHTADLSALYNPRAPLAFCFDFNVEPGVAAICQEVTLPNGLQGTAVLGEVYIPRNSNTPAVCRKLIADWGNHQGAVRCYGDATGGSRGSAKVLGSDWDLIKASFRNSILADKVTYRVPSHNPPERARVNAVNSRLMSEDGQIRLMVDAKKAPHVVRDFEGVCLLKGGSGEIDKKSTPELTHMCFGKGTMVRSANGNVKIEDLPKNGLVYSWDGSLIEYSNAGVTQENANTVKLLLSNGEVIACTEDHKFLTTEGWICAKLLKNHYLLTPNALLNAVKLSRFFKGWLISDTMEKKDISDALQIAVNNICIELFGAITTEKSRLDTTSTTLTEIEQIIRLIILHCKTEKNISRNTIKTYLQSFENAEKSILKKPKKKPLNGIEAKRGELGIVNTLKAKKLQSINASACIAAKNSCQNCRKKCFAQDLASLPEDIIRAWITKFAIANIVTASLSQINTQKRDFVAENVLVQVKDVSRSDRQDVYCLYVPSSGCFCLKDGFIVSNSDAFGYYVIGEYPTTNRTASVQTYSSMRR